jgi:hypothetical protein
MAWVGANVGASASASAAASEGSRKKKHSKLLRALRCGC